MKALLLAVVLTVSLTGCASIMSSRHRQIPFRSTPSGAEVWLDGKRYGVTPILLKLRHGIDYQVVFKLDGHEDRSYVMRNRMEGGWLVLDILCGIFPIAIDASTRAWYYLKDDKVEMDMAAGIVEPKYAHGYALPENVRVVWASPDSSAAGPPDLVKQGLYRVRIRKDREVKEIVAIAVAPASFGAVKVTLEDLSTQYVEGAWIESIVDDEGTSHLERVLTERKSIP